jgi:hypothetical protein
MRKFELAAALAVRYGYRRYLEVCTPGTGGTYSQVDRTVFTHCRRLMYRCPREFSDGLPIDYRTESESSEAPLRELYEQGERFDLVFVDPWHTYDASFRDLAAAFRLLQPDGAMLVHDCNPADAQLASPEALPNYGWCGLTYAAWMDWLPTSRRLAYVTVDTDYGCGIVGSARRLRRLWGYPWGGWASRLQARVLGRRPADTPAQQALLRQWRQIPLADKYPFFDRHRAALVRLISAEEFCRRIGIPQPNPAPV